MAEYRTFRYLFVTGWNPKTNKVFQWDAGGNAAIYGFQQRIGTYDPQQKAYIAQAEGIISGGIEHSNAVKITIVDKDQSTFDKNFIQGGVVERPRRQAKQLRLHGHVASPGQEHPQGILR